MGKALPTRIAGIELLVVTRRHSFVRCTIITSGHRPGGNREVAHSYDKLIEWTWTSVTTRWERQRKRRASPFTTCLWTGQFQFDVANTLTHWETGCCCSGAFLDVWLFAIDNVLFELVCARRMNNALNCWSTLTITISSNEWSIR